MWRKDRYVLRSMLKRASVSKPLGEGYELDGTDKQPSALHPPGVRETNEWAQLPHSSPKSSFLGTALRTWQTSEEGPEEGSEEGGARAMWEKRRRKVGIGPEEKGWGHRRAELTHRHVGARSNKGVGHGVYELAAHAKVTQLDLPTRVDQDIGGLHIYVARGYEHKNTIIHLYYFYN